MSIPIKINSKDLYQIMNPDGWQSTWTEAQVIQYSIEEQMFPTEVHLTSETYSKDAERTADYEMKSFKIANRKAKPEFTWSLIKHDYVVNLFEELNYYYGFKDANGNVNPVDAPDISITYTDFVGERTINTYLGQTIEGTLVEYDGVLYWQNLRIAFPER